MDVQVHRWLHEYKQNEHKGKHGAQQFSAHGYTE